MRRFMVPWVAAALSLAALATPALARPLEHEHYSGSDSFVFEDGCGTDWAVEVTFSGNFMLKDGRDGSPPYFFDNYQYREVWTDVSDPDRVVIHQGNGLWRDQHITLVEGTTFHFEIIESGQPSTWWTGDGQLIFRDRGSIVWEFTVDTQGDDDLSNDELVSEEGPTRINGPHPELLSTFEEFCHAVNSALDG